MPELRDSASLTVTNISHTNGNSDTVSTSTTYSDGTSIVGTYGTLTIGADGSYTYTADQDAADSIAEGSSETDVFTATGEYSGDVMDTSSSGHTDSDADGDTITVTQIRKSGGSDSTVSSGSSYNSSGTSVTGTYGTLTIGADGSYTYIADQTAADALDAGDSADDVFVYTRGK